MFFLALPVLADLVLTAAVGTIAAKAASDLYDSITSDDDNNK